MRNLALIMALMLTACGSSTPPASTPMPGGPRAEPLPGWVDYCHRHPEEPTCPSN